jgi:thiol-disulfide isomerase/thioredoxin
MAQLRGRVVVVHFYTYGCINCIHNLPYYNQWFDTFAGSDVTIIGIHTPETLQEYDIDTVRRGAASARLKYQIAIDNGHKNWDA